jgi:hypothetical protein
VVEVNDQEIILSCMPHECGVPFLLGDDHGYSHGGRDTPNRAKLHPACVVVVGQGWAARQVAR